MNNVKKILLVGINSKFSHTNLAIRYLCHALAENSIKSSFSEYTINQPVRDILSDIASQQPDILLFSVYIWNIDYVLKISKAYKLMYPDTVIIAGGPEVSFGYEQFLVKNPHINAVITGEGEAVLPGVLMQDNIQGVYKSYTYIDMDALLFPYDDLKSLGNRVLYYESTRGCPFGCAYCLSSADRVVRYRSLPLVFSDLQKFLDAGSMQVKFVDRTFNVNPERAYAIWEYLIEHDNGKTSFQMEIGGDLTNEKQLELLKKARVGLFQFEIGVQSTYEKTLNSVARKTDLEKLRQNVKAVKSFGNIHQHLDLIAGLPYENFERFKESYNDVFSMKPEMLQLGFLKLLEGSTLYKEKDALKLISSPFAPYEILSTPCMDFKELSRLKKVDDMTETYYNSGRFSRELEYILSIKNDPFDLFLNLGERLPQRPLSKYEFYDHLFEYAASIGADKEKLSWLMRLDLCLHEKLGKLPLNCSHGALPEEKRERLPRGREADIFYDLLPKNILNLKETSQELTVVAFNYKERDPHGHAKIVLL